MKYTFGNIILLASIKCVLGTPAPEITISLGMNINAPSVSSHSVDEVMKSLLT